MYSILEFAILNALTASVMAVVAVVVSRYVRRPAVVHTLWVLVLLKLITPPIVAVPVGLRMDHLSSLRDSSEPDDIDQPYGCATELEESSAANRVAVQNREIHTSAAEPALELPANGTDVSDPQVVTSETLAAQCQDVEPHDQTVFPAKDVSAESQAELLPGSHDGDAWTSQDKRLRAASAQATGTDWLVARWLPTAVSLVLWGWLGGLAIWFVIQGIRILQFRRFLAFAELAPDSIQQQTQRLAASMGIRTAPQVWVISATISPMLCAVGFRARLLFPIDLLDRMNADSRATLLVHELAHYRRRDHWVRLLEFVVTGLFWWHPVVWLARARIEAVEEECCDAWVVGQFSSQPRCYAEALLDTIDFLAEARPRPLPMASTLGDVPFLRKRIKMIMSGVAPKSMSGRTRLLLLLTAGLLLPLGPSLFQSAAKHVEAAIARIELVTHLAASSDAPLLLPVNDASMNSEASPTDILPAVDEPFPEIGEQVSTYDTAVSPDGRFEVLFKTDKSALLHNRVTKQTFDLTDFGISRVAFSPDSHLLVAGGANAAVFLFATETGLPVGVLKGHESAVRSVAFSPDGRHVATASRGGVVKVWDVATEQAKKIASLAGSINCVRFSPDGKLLAIARGQWTADATADAGGEAVIWDWINSSIVSRHASNSPVGVVAFVDADSLIAASWDESAVHWNFRLNRNLKRMVIDKDLISLAECSPRNSRALVEAALTAPAMEPESKETAAAFPPATGRSWSEVLENYSKTVTVPDSE